MADQEQGIQTPATPNLEEPVAVNVPSEAAPAPPTQSLIPAAPVTIPTVDELAKAGEQVSHIPDNRVIRLSTGHIAVGNSEDIEKALKVDPGATEIPNAPGYVTVRLSSGHIGRMPKEQVIDAMKADPKMRVLAGDTKGMLDPNAKQDQALKELAKPPDAHQMGMGPEAEFVTGMGKGAVETLRGLKGVIAHVVGEKVADDWTTNNMPKIMTVDTEGKTAYESAGKFAEGIAEWISGDAALKGLSVAAKLGLAGKIADLAKTSPYAARFISLGLDAVRGATVGGAIGGVKGAAGSEGLKGAAEGAVGGALMIGTAGLTGMGLEAVDKAAGIWLAKYAAAPPKEGAPSLGQLAVKYGTRATAGAILWKVRDSAPVPVKGLVTMMLYGLGFESMGALARDIPKELSENPTVVSGAQKAAHNLAPIFNRIAGERGFEEVPGEEAAAPTEKAAPEATPKAMVAPAAPAPAPTEGTAFKTPPVGQPTAAGNVDFGKITPEPTLGEHPATPILRAEQEAKAREANGQPAPGTPAKATGEEVRDVEEAKPAELAKAPAKPGTQKQTPPNHVEAHAKAAEATAVDGAKPMVYNGTVEGTAYFTDPERGNTTYTLSEKEVTPENLMMRRDLTPPPEIAPAVRAFQEVAAPSHAEGEVPKVKTPKIEAPPPQESSTRVIESYLNTRNNQRVNVIETTEGRRYIEYPDNISELSGAGTGIYSKSFIDDAVSRGILKKITIVPLGSAEGVGEPPLPKSKITAGTPEADNYIKQFKESHPEAVAPKAKGVAPMTDEEILATQQANKGTMDFRGKFDSEAEAQKKIDTSGEKYKGWKPFQIKYGNRAGEWRIARPIITNENLNSFDISKEEVIFGHEAAGHCLMADITDTPTKEGIEFTPTGARTRIDFDKIVQAEADHPEEISNLLATFAGTRAIEIGKNNPIQSKLLTFAAGPRIDEIMGYTSRNADMNVIGSDGYRFKKVLEALGIPKELHQQAWDTYSQHAKELLRHYPNAVSQAINFFRDPENVGRRKFSQEEVQKLVNDIRGKEAIPDRVNDALKTTDLEARRQKFWDLMKDQPVEDESKLAYQRKYGPTGGEAIWLAKQAMKGADEHAAAPIKGASTFASNTSQAQRMKRLEAIGKAGRGY